MIPCPQCSTYKHGQWLPCRPGHYFGKSAARHTLNACTTGCSVFGDGPGWVPEFDGVPPMTGSAELMPPRLWTREECEAELERWWAERVKAFDTGGWDADKLRKWEDVCE